MQRLPYWTYEHVKKYPALTDDIQCDVLIVGGGVGGVSLAYFLAKSTNKKVVLVEKNTIGSGATGHSAGMLLAEAESVTLPILSGLADPSTAAEYWNAQIETIEIVKQIIATEQIQCDAEVEPLYILANGPYGEAQIESDSAIRSVSSLVSQIYTDSSLYEKFGTDMYSLAERVQDGLSVNPKAFVCELADRAVKHGVDIFEYTAIDPSAKKDSIHATHSSAGYGTYKTDQGYTVSAKQIVWAIDAFDTDQSIEKYLTTCIVTEVLSEKDMEMIKFTDHKMFFETESISFHYAKYLKGNRLLFGFGDKKVTHPLGNFEPHDEHLQNIKKYISKLFPEVKIEISHAWSGVYGLHKGHFPLFNCDTKTKPITIRFGGAGTQILTITIAAAIAELLASVDSDEVGTPQSIAKLSRHNRVLLDILTNHGIDKTSK